MNTSVRTGTASFITTARLSTHNAILSHLPTAAASQASRSPTQTAAKPLQTSSASRTDKSSPPPTIPSASCTIRARRSRGRTKARSLASAALLYPMQPPLACHNMTNSAHVRCIRELAICTTPARRKTAQPRARSSSRAIARSVEASSSRRAAMQILMPTLSVMQRRQLARRQDAIFLSTDCEHMTGVGSQ